MRPFHHLLLLTPIIRASLASLTSPSFRRAIPTLSYPICRRNFTCASPLTQDYRAIMADLKSEEMAEVQRLAEPAGASEAEILGTNEWREEALKDLTKERKKEETPALPKLSAAEFRAYNAMAEHMEYFHNHFRQSWTLFYSACETNKRPASLTLKQFISTGLQFISHLTAHHSIEEQHIFPVLAQKMPEFKNGRNTAELLRQHREIHKGMDQFEEYLKQCKSGEVELELRVLKTKMDNWGTVLWTHLDQEVKTLGAENMRMYWSLDEMRRMPM